MAEVSGVVPQLPLLGFVRGESAKTVLPEIRLVMKIWLPVVVVWNISLPGLLVKWSGITWL